MTHVRPKTSPCRMLMFRPPIFITMVIGPVRAAVMVLSSIIPAEAGAIDLSDDHTCLSVACEEGVSSSSLGSEQVS